MNANIAVYCGFDRVVRGEVYRDLGLVRDFLLYSSCPNRLWSMGMLLRMS